MQRIGEETKVSGTTLEERLDVSNLTYLANDDSNLIVERSQKKQFADSPSFSPGNVIVVNFQTGSDYISGKDSTLRFEVDVTLAAGGALVAATDFGKGFCTNLFKKIRIISRSGDVVCDIDKANLLNFYKIRYDHTKAWRDQNAGALLGYGHDFNTTAKIECIVPLSILAPIFDTDMLLPNMLCKGLRIEITCESADVALKTAGDAVTYEITGVETLLDSYRLSEGAVNLLNNESKNRGLVMQYRDYENSSFTKDNGPVAVSFDVRKTVSMANSAMAVVRTTTAVTARASDSFESSAYEANQSYQFRIASTYLPVQPVEKAVQAYNQVGYCLGQLNKGKETPVTLGEFKAGEAISCVSIDRYWLENSGLALSNSTSLNFQSSGLNSAESNIDIFLNHTRSLNIYLENLVRSD
jgi:hypothetical protein